MTIKTTATKFNYLLLSLLEVLPGELSGSLWLTSSFSVSIR